MVRVVLISKYGQLFSASEDGTVRAWDLQTLEPDSRLGDGKLPRQKNLKVIAMAFEHNGRFLVGALWDGGFECWSVGAGFGEIVDVEELPRHHERLPAMRWMSWRSA